MTVDASLQTIPDPELLSRWSEGADARAFAELVARHDRMVVGVCRRIVRDDTLADDLAQDCFLRLAQQHAGSTRNVAGWLHRVATHSALSAVRARRPAVDVDAIEVPHHETPSRLAQWRELEAHVDAAIAELPDSLRDVVVGHFLEAQGQRELAERLGVPRRTVNHRIAKGIAQVRQSLARRGFDVDASALATALLALPTPTGLAPAWTASLGRVALAGPKPMLSLAGGGAALVALAGSGSAKTLWAGITAAAVLVLGMWWALEPVGRTAPRSEAARNESTRVASSGITEPLARFDQETERVPVTGQSSERSTSPAATAVDSAVVFGTCTSESGRPLAGVRVALTGTADAVDLDDWWLQHGESDWTDPEPVVSGADGRFEVRFEPSPPYRFEIELYAEGRVGASADLGQMAAGARIDLGTLEFPVGVRVYGRVVDTKGNPVAAQRLGIVRSPPPEQMGLVRQRSSVGCVTDANGHFECAHLLPAGDDYSIVFSGWVALEPKPPLTVSGAATGFRVVAPDTVAGPGTAISGTVRGAAGMPLAGARVRLEFADGLRWGATTSSTNFSGRFRVPFLRESGERDPVILEITHQGHAGWKSDPPLEWTEEELTIHLTPGPPLDVRVVDGTGRPIERYGLEFLSRDDAGGWRRTHGPLVHRGEHPEGRLHLEHVTPGLHRVSAVVPPALGLAPARAVEIEFVPGRPAVAEIVVPSFAYREVRVVDAHGMPREGLRVDLVRPRGDGPITIDLPAVSPKHAPQWAPDEVAELTDHQTTDSSGHCTLAGIGEETYAVRLPGPGNVPFVVQPVRADVREPLVVVLPAEATLRGRAGPADVLEQIRGAHALDDRDAKNPVGIALVSAADPALRVPSRSVATDGVLLDATGRFVLRGVPPGTWHVHLTWSQQLNASASAPAACTVVQNLSLVGGEVRHLDIDLEPLRRYEASFRLEGGAPPWPAQLMIHSESSPSVVGRDRPRLMQPVPCDAKGQARTTLTAGLWTVRPMLEIAGRRVFLEGSDVVVGPGQASEHRLPVRIGSRRVLLLRPDGSPAVRRYLGVRDGAASSTDEEGRTTVWGTPGSVEASITREPFDNAPVAVDKWFQGRPKEDFRLIQLDVGPIELLAIDGEEHVIRLPPEWMEIPK